jgi:hypothetical protein
MAIAGGDGLLLNAQIIWYYEKLIITGVEKQRDFSTTSKKGTGL